MDPTPLLNACLLAFQTAEPEFENVPHAPSWLLWLYGLQSLLLIPGLCLWVWMLVDCIRNEEDRNLWLWILIFFNAIGSVLYFLFRWLPRRRRFTRTMTAWFSRGRTLGRLQAAAHQIGNPHQFVQWGEALREAGQLAQARHAFEQALAKDPQNLPALWGIAQVEQQQGNFAQAREHLQTILSIDASYKFGDVSLAYGRALTELQDETAARQHLEQHVSRWTHPEAIVRLSVLLIKQGETAAARQRLSGLLIDMQGCPRYFARQNSAWTSQAKKLLRTLPPESSPFLS